MVETKITKEFAMTVVLIALVIFAGAQAVQIANIKEQISSGTISVASSTQQAQPVQQQARQAAPAQSQMVGGC